MTRYLALPRRLAARPFRASTSGLSRSRLRASDLSAPHRDVRVPAALVDDLLMRCVALSTVLPEGACFSHRTAALLWGVPMPASGGDDLHVTVPAPVRAPRIRGVVGHQSRAVERVRVPAGLWVSTPGRAICDSAPDLDRVQLVSVVDHLLSTRTAADLSEAIAAHPHPQVARLTRALAEARPGVDSPRETALRLAIVDAGFPEPVVNGYVQSAEGFIVAKADLSYPRYRVAIEYEGDHHRTDRRQWFRDVARYRELESLDWIALRVTTADLTPSPRDLLAQLALHLRRRGCPLPTVRLPPR
ncbi:hypothetical protein NY547_01910 [Cnuibacter physcomitrellae]|uniref:hypothetical protein n=1 Tax=Cnuibacter physcomitrellae TaxID=1619308 RepID=UPI00217619B8|nr:hypothetical protein [Cnuibacter physcomitrellae]MCS5495993.1 hypothetical protein [Cnuibacter physcomitrellae]